MVCGRRISILCVLLLASLYCAITVTDAFSTTPSRTTATRQLREKRHCHSFSPKKTTKNTELIHKKHSTLALFKLHLFSMNLNGDNNRADDPNNDQQQDDIEISDFNTQVQTLQANDQVDNEYNNNNENDDDETEELSSWVEGLKRWPLIMDTDDNDNDLNINDGDNINMYNNENNNNNNDDGDDGDDSSNNDNIQEMSNNEKKAAAEASSRYRVNPLTYILDLEALLEASGRNPKDFPNVFATSDQWIKTWMGSDESNSKDTNGEEVNKKDEDKKIDVTKQSFTKTNITAVIDKPISEATAEDFLIFDSLNGLLQNAIGDFISNPASTVQQESDQNQQPMIPSIDSVSATDKIDIVDDDDDNEDSSISKVAGSIFKDATSRVEEIVSGASNVLNPASLQDVITRASAALYYSSPYSSTNSSEPDIAILNTTNIVKVAERVAQDQGLNVSEASARARATTRYAAGLVSVANIVFEAGFAYTKEQKLQRLNDELLPTSSPSTSRSSQSSPPLPLLSRFESATLIPHSAATLPIILKATEMGNVAGAIYQDTLSRLHGIGHSMVANGTTADVAWLITDSIGYEKDYREDSETLTTTSTPVMIRTITFRGFDASDENVDREDLLNVICSAHPSTMENHPNILIHSGLYSIAKQLYKEIKPYMKWTAPNHKLVLNGHSIGGALSVLILLMLVDEYGADYVKSRFLRVFTFGSPPVAASIESMKDNDKKSKGKKKSRNIPFFPIPGNGKQKETEYHCNVLETFGLPSSMVYGFVQPWDPIVRFFTEYDALYPLVDDLGKDGMTLYASGPPRSLRRVTRAIISAWDGWPRFRDNWKGSTNQRYRSVGIQHLLLPEPIRYLSDRFVSVNVAVPPIESLVRLSPDELLPALDLSFPLDVFQISFVPQCIRSFLHHFYPAYDIAMTNYAIRAEKEAIRSISSQQKQQKQSTQGKQDKNKKSAAANSSDLKNNNAALEA